VKWRLYTSALQQYFFGLQIFMRRILVKLPEKIKFNGTSTHEIVTLLNVPGHFLDTPFPAQIIEDVLLVCVLDGSMS
jgi:hypothetical protein